VITADLTLTGSTIKFTIPIHLIFLPLKVSEERGNVFLKKGGIAV
jgi:hypothetical protein